MQEKGDLQYVLKNISDMVVKEVHGAGGYGMLVGPKSTKKQIEEFTEKLKANPANYIAQPTLSSQPARSSTGTRSHRAIST